VGGDDRSKRFTRFYREHYGRVLSTCRRRVDEQDAAEDVASEVFRIAWQRFRADDDPSISWLYTVTRNVVGSEYRRRARSRNLQRRLEALARVDHESLRSAEPSALIDAVRSLRASDQNLLYWFYWEGRSAADIGRVLKVSEGALWVKLSRARATLRKSLDSESSAE
jgi:RNA polymerase sigma-70 factor (ECF subfamily)